MADKKKIVIIDGLTNEVIERDMTEDEMADLENLSKEASDAQDLEQAKVEARTSALAKLATLGLTEEEIAAL
jgi:hypothetical protein